MNASNSAASYLMQCWDRMAATTPEQERFAALSGLATKHLREFIVRRWGVATSGMQPLPPELAAEITAEIEAAAAGEAAMIAYSLLTPTSMPLSMAAMIAFGGAGAALAKRLVPILEREGRADLTERLAVLAQDPTLHADPSGAFGR